MSSGPSQAKLRVVIAGGGLAALEAALGLAELAPKLTAVTVIAPNDETVSRPMTVREPFAYPRAERYALAPFVAHAGAQLLADSLASVDAENRTVRTTGGGELPYDALVLALGARMNARYEHSITIDDHHLDETMRGLIQDVEGGYVKRIAYLVPGLLAWPLPLYEIALMTAGRAYDMDVELEATVVTPEDSPLAIFGTAASEAVYERLQRAHVQTFCSSSAEVPRAGEVIVNPGQRELQTDRIVALPELSGPEIAGVPAGEHGFLRISPHCEMLDLERVYAVGDCADFPVKHGGLASQMADAAAESIAALAGAEVDPQPFDSEIRGMLLTDGKPLYMQARLSDGHGVNSQVSDSPMWSPPDKISTKYLGAYMQAHEGAGATSRS